MRMLVRLQKVDLSRNMHRFYRLDTQPDLFGGVFLMKQWGAASVRMAGSQRSVLTAPTAPPWRCSARPNERGGEAIAKRSDPGDSGHAGDAAGTADPMRP